VTGVRRAHPPDVPAVSTTLARAFLDDPVACYLFADAADRPAMLEEFFTLQLRRNYLRRGVVYATENLDGASMWMPPEAPSPTLVERACHFVFSLQLGRRRAVARRLMALLEARHPREAHWYVGAIGVDPDRQRCGVGGSLLTAGLEQCDRGGRGVYLEASRPESARLYERHGFECLEVIDSERVGFVIPELFLMYRPGRSDRAGR
jgi:GNAT superfamily N-acetyltransferase